MQNFEIDDSIAYFIGVLHSDGCIYRFHDKKDNFIRIRLILAISKKSLPMAHAFQRILLEKFNRKVNLRKVPNKNCFVIQTSINRLYNVFSQWEDNKVPKEIQKESKLFGAYLAGLIDGDGHVKYKKNKQGIFACQIRIASGEPLYKILKLIKFHLNCGAHIEKSINKLGMGYNNCFLISKKNYKFLQKYVAPFLTIPYKKERVKKYIKKWA